MNNLFSDLSSHSFNIENVCFSFVVQDMVQYKFNASNADYIINELHRHNFYETFIVADGTVNMQLESGKTTLHAGDYLLIKKDTLHCMLKHENNFFNYYVICFQYKNNRLACENDLFKLLETHLNKPIIFNTNSNMCDIIYKIFDCKLNNRIGLIQAYLYEFILTLTDDIKKSVPDLDYNSPLARLFLIENFMRGNFEQNLTLADLSKQLYLSPKQINRIIKKNFNCTYKEYILALRMTKAKKLLTITDLTVTDIAEQLGYSSLSSFYTAFKNATGLLPLQFRNSAIMLENKPNTP